MDSNILFTALGLPFGCLGLYVWYVETYTDTPLAQFWRAYSKANVPRRVNEIAIPLWMLSLISGSLLLFSVKIALPQYIQSVIAGSIPFFLVLSIVFLLPIPIPHLVDQQWQWHKRHGFIDENGKIITSTPHQTNTQTYPIGQQTMTIKTSMELSETWRAVDLNNPNSPLIPHLPHTSTTLNTLKNSLFIAVSAPERSTGFRSNLIITMDPTNQKPIPLEEAIPGWLTIEEVPFPIRSPDATMSSGIYIDDHQSYTAIQWTWTQRIAEHNIRVYATLTSTTTNINHIANDLPDMISSLEITQ
ncbi:Uncharacterised protein [Schaalia odontolytica]|jgi:hypothetical protein|uniref:Uncharacterized protein n=1 Tax=Schaalia odontolytica TaxID=1660 RepID=A0A6N2TUZ0_9ACTO